MISGGYYDRLSKVESGDNPSAQNPASSAKGRFQFIDSTAKQYGITAEFGTPEYEQQERVAVEKFSSDNFNALKQTFVRRFKNAFNRPFSLINLHGRTNGFCSRGQHRSILNHIIG